MGGQGLHFCISTDIIWWGTSKCKCKYKCKFRCQWNAEVWNCEKYAKFCKMTQNYAKLWQITVNFRYTYKCTALCKTV